MDLYYVVLNYNSSRISSKDYLKEIFNQVSKKNPKFKYLLKQVSVKNGRDFYILELYITDKNTRYKIYSVIYDSGSVIYDFSYKTLDDEKENAKNYQTFYSVLFSFEHEDDIVIDGEKFIIKNHKIITYQDL